MFAGAEERRLELTFVAADPGRMSRFVWWDPSSVGGFLPPTAGDELPLEEIEVIAPAGDDPPTLHTVAARQVPLQVALSALAELPVTADASESSHYWAAVVRSALGLVARGRLLPWVSPEGFDTWRVDPLDSADLDHVEALAAAMPAVAHAVPDPGHVGRLRDPGWLVRTCYDAIADRLVRSPAAVAVAQVDPFASLTTTRVRHLRSWTEAAATPHCLTSQLVLWLHPPRPEEPGGVPRDDEELDRGEPDRAGVAGDPDGEWRLHFELRSRRDHTRSLTADQCWADSASAAALLGPTFDVELLLALERAAAICPALEPALEQHQPAQLLLDDAALEQLLDAADDLAAAGIDMRWPADLVLPKVVAQLVVGSETNSGELPSFTDLQSLLDVDWEFLIDGLPLSRRELDALSNSKRGIVSLRGKWVRVSTADRARLRRDVPRVAVADVVAGALEGAIEVGLDGNAGASAGGAFAADVVPVRVVGGVEKLMRHLADLDGTAEVAEPPGLHATLRPYQRQGLAWLAGLATAGMGGCLADDMGLGKTLQVLALHAMRGGPTLVVCPTSVVTNWEREAARFVPGARVVRHHGAGRQLRTPEAGDLVVTTYGVVRSDVDLLAAVDWDIVVADEAQSMKNPRSRTARAMRQVSGRTRIALTGTPVENRLRELWSILDWSMPGLLGTEDDFHQRLAVRIERDADPQATTRLSKLIAPFLLRRRKTDPGIAPDLPPKTERDVAVQLTPEQVSLYKATTADVLDEIRHADGISRRGLVLKLLTALKQITNHPAQFLDERQPIVGRSGKLAEADELVDLAISSGESMLVFTQYVRMGNLLEGHWRDRGIDVAFLHGGMSVPERQRMVDRFQAGEIRLLVLSLKAAGTGLNLTAATQVLHYDRWWNPAVEDQATDRAYRIGQTAPVTVHRLLSMGTVEERVAQLLDAKRDLADRVVGGDSWISELDDDELTDLVSLDAAGSDR